MGSLCLERGPSWEMTEAEQKGKEPLSGECAAEGAE